MPAEAIAPPAAGAVAPPALALPREEKVNILIVDDRADKLLALQTAIEPLDENLVSAHSGREALRCLLQQDFAVILLDVNMPGMDGFETAGLIRARPRTALTPIIFVSAINDAEDHIRRGYRLGAVDFILSPIIPEILRAKVSVFVDLFRKTAQIERAADERANRIRAEAGQAEAEAGRERMALLAEASRVLGSSLEPEETFAALARLTVPRLADYCTIDAVEDGVLRTVAVAHRNPDSDERLREFRGRFPFTAEEDFGIGEVMASGRSKTGVLTGEQRIGAGHSAEQREVLGELNIGSYLLAPMRAHGRVLGTLCLVSMSERPYTAEEITLAEELAQRAGLALDNAALYRTAQRARDEAERANAAKDQFLAMLSHELRTPLTPVLHTVALIESDDVCSERLQEALMLIRRNVELEARLIDDLLDLTRVSKGKVQLNLEQVEAHDLLTRAVDICRPDLEAKEQTLDQNFAATRQHLRADPARLQQIFWNLIKNAVKFTPRGGRLTVATSDCPEGRICVEVSDTGVGIEPEMIPRIFNAFEQAQGGEKLGGLGLGLAITKALVTMHGGEIAAHSAGRDAGSAFVLRFPTVQPEEVDGSAASPKVVPERLALRVLLVEDHDDTRNTLGRLLGRRGYEVQTANGVEDAVRVAEGFAFDVLISDMGLPDGSGIEVMERLAERRPTCGVALSGYGMEEDVQRSIAVGFREHLTKPIDISRLDEVVQRVARECRG